MNVALIAAAGWKAAGIRTKAGPDTPEFVVPLYLCPEPLLPISDGETTLSRMAAQLAALDFECHIAVGRPGCTYPETAKQITSFVPEAESICDISPWTALKVAYAGQFGKLHMIMEPDERTGWDSICLMLDELEALKVPWTRALLILGDCIFPPGSLEHITNGDFPCWYISSGFERLFWLDRGSIETWRNHIWRIRTRETNTEQQFADLTSALASTGANLYKIDTKFDWTDIDHWQSYERILGKA